MSLLFLSCNETKNEDEDNSQKIEHPINPEIKTDYGQFGEMQTMDEYYIDNNGNKIWHGYRKNLYPSMQPKTVSYYEYGEEMWTESYDEVGNVLTSTR